MRALFLFTFLIIFTPSYIISDSCDGNCVDGKGIKVFSNGDRYEGEFKKGIFDGEGIFQSSKGYKYSGKYKDGKRNGFGIWISGENKNDNSHESLLPSNNKDLPLTNSKSIHYEGEWKNNRREGKGKLVIKKNGKVKKYSGHFINGKLNGQGTLETEIARYSGIFKNNRLNGQGVYENQNGEKYIGGFLDFKFEGKGTYTFKDKSLYIGDFKAGKLHGKGRLFNSKHKVIRSGRWEAGEFKE
jgi:hypothetical protein